MAVAALSCAQEFPYELESHRKPAIQTGGNVLIRGGRVLTGTGKTYAGADILVRNGKIAAIGPNLTAPSGVQVIDAKGKVVTPGLVDAHQHRGSDGTNEGSESITGEVRITDVINPAAKNLWQALASGETTGLVLHGSANAIGGESVVMKFKYGRAPEELPVPDAPRQIKFALGENVTRMSSSTSTRFPRTRMGVETVYRRAFNEARAYTAEWEAYRRDDAGKAAPRKDLRLEILSDILAGKVWVQCHSYRADEMLMMVRLSQEFGFKLNMQHALEGYKIAPELAKAGVGVSVFADNWAYKLEAYDAIPYSMALTHRAGVLTSINSDSLGGTIAINLDAAKAMHYGGVSEADALAMITLNPAKQIGIDHRTGSLEVGKDGDLVLWDGHPFSVYSRCAMTLIEGEVFFQRRDAFGVDKSSMTKSVLDTPRKRAPQALKPSNVYAIVGARVFPVSSPPIEGGTVVIADGKIAAVGKGVAIPRGAVRVDGRGLHVYPGLIDGSTTMGLVEISGISVMNQTSESGDFQPDLKAVAGVQVESAFFGTSRANGVLSVLSRPAGGVVSGRSSVLNTWGWTAESMGLKPLGPLSVNFPGAGGGRFGGDTDDAYCCDDDLINRLIAGGWSDGHLEHLTGAPIQGRRGQGGGNRGPTDAQLKPLTEFFEKAAAYAKDGPKDGVRDLGLEAMVPYVTGKEPVLLRVRNTGSIRAAVKFAETFGLKAVLVGAQDAWKEAPLLAKAKIPVLIAPAGKSTGFANAPSADWEPYDTPYVLPALLQKAGVRYAFMTDSNGEAMNLPFRVGQSCAYGLSWTDALRACTLSTAEILGVADKLGSLEVGKVANVLVTDGDPFELTTNVQHAFIAGRPVPLTSKFTELYERYGQRIGAEEKAFGGG